MSLSRLQRDCVDVLQLHTGVALTRNTVEWPGALSVQDVLGEHGVADAFDTLRDQGLTKHIGFTGLGETAALQRVVESNRFDVVQTYFNLLNPSSGYTVPSNFNSYDFEQLINKAAEHTMGVIAIRVMAAGAVGGEEARKGHAAPTIQNPMVPGGEYGKDEARVQRLNFLIHGAISSLPQVALKFVLMHPEISTALVGFSNCNQIQEAVQSTTLPPLPSAHLEKLKVLWGYNNCLHDLS
jgi:aryl-alcohol dehydrogenase-like predicted oxidoreductase